jgi:hypothetical protein
MNMQQTKNKVIKLRTEGFTYSEINAKLKTKISKSTLSSWLKNINLSSEQKLKLERNISQKLRKSQEKAWQVNKIKRTKYLSHLKNKNQSLLKEINPEIEKLLLSILYLGEGSKSKSTDHLSLASSNPNIIRLYLFLLKNCFDIDASKYRVRIQCRADQNIKKLEKYWLNLTKIPKKQLYPTYIDKRTINKPTQHVNYKGVCTIIYFDRSVQYELEFLADSVVKYLNKGR